MAIPRTSRLPVGWKLVRVGEIVTSRRLPITPTLSGQYREIGIRSHGKGIFHKPFVSGATLGDKRVFHVVPGCLVLNIVFAWEGAVAATSDAESGMIASHRFPMFSPTHHSSVDIDFLRRYFISPEGVKLLGDASPGGAGRNRTLNQSDFASIRLPLPPLPEQKKIAAVLSSVDAAIEKTEAVIAQLQVVKKAMMEQLLTKGMPGRHTRFKQTELGEIPEEWEVAALGDVSETRSGGTPDRQRPDYWCGSIPWIKTAEVNYSLIESAEESITEEGLKNSAAHVFPIGTILMAMYGQGTTRGRVAILGIPAATNQACLGITPGARLCTQYLFQWLKDQYDSIRKIGNEGAQKNLNAGLIRSLRIPIPHIDEQKFIAKSLDSIDARCSSEQLIMRQLTAVKSSLSSSLLSGELRVPTDSVPCPV